MFKWDWTICLEYSYHYKVQYLTQLEEPLWLFKEKENLHFDLSNLCISSLVLKSWDVHLCDSRWLTKWDNSETDATIKSVCGVDSAHNRATCLTMSDLGSRSSLPCCTVHMVHCSPHYSSLVHVYHLVQSQTNNRIRWHWTLVITKQIMKTTPYI